MRTVGHVTEKQMTSEVADGTNGCQHPIAWWHIPSSSQRAAVKRTLNLTALSSVLEKANVQNKAIPFRSVLAAPTATPSKRRPERSATADSNTSLKEAAMEMQVI
jgi:hypothetical protein